MPHRQDDLSSAMHFNRVVFVSCSAHHLSYRLMGGCRTPGAWRSAVDGAGAGRYFMPVQAFALSKAAQILYSRALASMLEHQGAPVMVHAVNPGLTAHGLAALGGLPDGSWLRAAQSAAAGGLMSLGALKSAEQAAASVAFVVAAPASLMAVKVVVDDGRGSCAACVDGTSSTAGVAPWCGGAGAGAAAEQQDGGVSTAPPAVSVSGRYIEDCRLSLPAPDARDPAAEAALWQVTQELLLSRLGPECPASWHK
jgi:hypothetical protein